MGTDVATAVLSPTTVLPYVDLPAAAAAAMRYAGKALATATLRAYTRDWARYETWCAAGGLDPLPPNPAVVAMFLSHHAEMTRPKVTKAGAPAGLEPRYTRATIDRWVAGLTWGFKHHGYASPLTHPDVEATLAGIRRDIGPQRVTRRMKPLLLADISQILAAMPVTWPEGVAAIRDQFVILVGFAGAFRRSELCALRTGHVTVDRHDGLRIYLPKAKTDQEGEGAIRAVPYGTQALTCGPCAAWHWWNVLAAADDRSGRMAAVMRFRSATGHVCREDWPMLPDDSQPVLRPVDKHGNIGDRAATGDAVNLLVKKRAAQAGLQADVELLGGHSLRAGFVTQAVRSGASYADVMTQTGHTQQTTVRNYVREHDPLRNNAVTKLGL
jgi:integrase